MRTTVEGDSDHTDFENVHLQRSFFYVLFVRGQGWPERYIYTVYAPYI
jgi:hypothetical protein